MNKNKLIEEIASKTNLSKTDSASAADAFLEAIVSSLSKGEEVRLVGFGTFLVTKRKATTGRNPRTGEVIQIAAANHPKFRAGSVLKQAVN